MRVSWRLGLVTVAMLIATANRRRDRSIGEREPGGGEADEVDHRARLGRRTRRVSRGQPDRTPAPVVLAWAKWINANGGIAGHPVNVIAKDVGTDPAKTESTVKDLVENQHVIVFVGNAASSTDSVYKQYLIDKNIPLVGGQSYSSAMANDQLLFPASPGVFTSVWMQPYAASQANAKQMGLFWCSSNPACAGAVGLYKNDATSVGATLVFDEKIDDVASDYTANCLAA